VITVVASFVDALTIAVLGLAALGLYGTLSFTFARRRHDIGVRVALGAAPRDIVALVVRQAFVWVAVGATIGVGASWLLGRGLRAMLEGASPVDLLQLWASVAIVLSAAALASWLPARRAVRVDPVEALRAE
jgi:ABC-type antimicrobial peptide transport system permease subunit